MDEATFYLIFSLVMMFLGLWKIIDLLMVFSKWVCKAPSYGKGDKMITLWSRDMCERMTRLVDRIMADNSRPPVDVYFHNGAIVAYCDDHKGDRVKYSSVRIAEDGGGTKVVVIQELGDLEAAGGQNRQEVARNTEMYELYLRTTPPHVAAKTFDEFMSIEVEIR